MKAPISTFFMTVPLCILFVLILITSFSSCSKPNLGDIVREHIQAVNTYDIEKNLALFTDDAVFKIGARTKFSGKDQLRTLMESDAAKKVWLTILDMKVEGDTVVARLSGKNEFVRLLGVEESLQSCAYKFRGRFLEKVTVEFLEGGGLFDEKYKLFAEWASREHPQEFKKVEAGAYTAENTRLLLSLAKEWRDNIQTESAEQELIRLENNWNDAIVKHDWTFFDQILAEDYISTNFDGSVGTKADFLEFLRSGESVMASSTVDDMKVRIYGDAAVVTGRFTTVKELYQDKDLSGRYRFTDTWVKRAGQWQCVAEHVSRIAQK